MAEETDIQRGRPFQLLLSIDDHTWNHSKIAERFQFERHGQCWANGLVMFTDQSPSTCPSWDSSYEDNSINLSRHILTPTTVEKFNISNSSLKKVLSGSSWAGGDRVYQYANTLLIWNTTLICSLYRGGATARYVLGFILDMASAEIKGKFKLEITADKSLARVDFRQCVISPDGSRLCLLVRFKPRRDSRHFVGGYELMVYSRDLYNKGNYIYRFRKGGIGHINRVGPMVLFPPDFQGKKVIVVNLLELETYKERIVVADLDLEKGSYTNALLFRNSVLSALNWNTWIIQAATCNPSGSIIALSCEEVVGQAIHPCKLFLIDTVSLNLLHVIDHQVSLFVECSLMRRVCYLNMLPMFSACGELMAVNHYDNDEQPLVTAPTVRIYQLPHQLNLQSICRSAIRRILQDEEDVSKLPLPAPIKDYLKCI